MVYGICIMVYVSKAICHPCEEKKDHRQERPNKIYIMRGTKWSAKQCVISNNRSILYVLETHDHDGS
jgi:hypothetical protein